VSHVADDLPCGLINDTCQATAAGLGLVACVDQLFARDGTCDPTPDQTFTHFTALPPPTDYQATCYNEKPPCTATTDATRFTLDAEGNLLIPVHWQGILVSDATSAVPRLLRATLRPPVPVTLPDGLFVTSLTPQGQRLPPIFEPQIDPTAPTGVLTFFGSVDVADTVLRIAHRRGVCSGGTAAGAACGVDLDCQGGLCVDACVGGSRDGLACVEDNDCRRGRCRVLYDAPAFAALATNGGPIVLPKPVPPQTGGVCEIEPHNTCTSNGNCPGADNLCALYALQAQNPVSLDSLTTRTDDLRAFTVRRAGPLPLYGSSETLASLSQKFNYIFDERVRPPPGTSKPQLRPVVVEPGTAFTVGDVEILPVEVSHGTIGVLAYRIGKLAYVTDAKAVPAAAIDQLRGVRVLVINALFRTEHPSHLSIPEAIAVARELGAERTYLTHLTHDNFHADLEAELPPGVTPAFDGLTVRID